jgi:hypothetical protein
MEGLPSQSITLATAPTQTPKFHFVAHAHAALHFYPSNVLNAVAFIC